MNETAAQTEHTSGRQAGRGGRTGRRGRRTDTVDAEYKTGN